VAGDLNEDVGLGQVEAGVRHLAHEDRVHLGAGLALKNPTKKATQKNQKKPPKKPTKNGFFVFF
jgi:hypothetical protein